jgi:hypothetical protein
MRMPSLNRRDTGFHADCPFANGIEVLFISLVFRAATVVEDRRVIVYTK